MQLQTVLFLFEFFLCATQSTLRAIMLLLMLELVAKLLDCARTHVAGNIWYLIFATIFNFLQLGA